MMPGWHGRSPIWWTSTCCHQNRGGCPMATMMMTCRHGASWGPGGVGCVQANRAEIPCLLELLDVKRRVQPSSHFLAGVGGRCRLHVGRPSTSQPSSRWRPRMGLFNAPPCCVHLVVGAEARSGGRCRLGHRAARVCALFGAPLGGDLGVWGNAEEKLEDPQGWRWRGRCIGLVAVWLKSTDVPPHMAVGASGTLRPRVTRLARTWPRAAGLSATPPRRRSWCRFIGAMKASCR